MMEALIDALAYLLLIGGALAVCIALAAGICRLSDRLRQLQVLRRRRERADAVRLYRLVERQVPGKLTMGEYARAVRYAARKYHLAGRCGEMDLQGHDLEYISALVAEAVGQARLSRGTLAIAAADRGLEQSEKSERNETA